MSSSVLLNATAIRHALSSSLREKLTLEVLAKTTSTIDYLQSKLPNPAISLPYAVLAEQQTHGKGQLNKQWYAPPGQNIYLSCAWLFNKSLQELSGLSLVVGLAVISALKKFDVGQALKIKWPNDIFWQNKKLAGILIVLNTVSAKSLQAIVSVGLNVNMTSEADKPIPQPWSSLQLISQVAQDRNKIAADLLQNIFAYLTVFTDQGLQPFLQEWYTHDFLLGNQITLTNSQGQRIGIAHGIDTQGHLLLKTADARITSHVSGEISKFWL